MGLTSVGVSDMVRKKEPQGCAANLYYTFLFLCYLFLFVFVAIYEGVRWIYRKITKKSSQKKVRGCVPKSKKEYQEKHNTQEKSYLLGETDDTELTDIDTFFMDDEW